MLKLNISERLQITMCIYLIHLKPKVNMSETLQDTMCFCLIHLTLKINTIFKSQRPSFSATLKINNPIILPVTSNNNYLDTFEPDIILTGIPTRGKDNPGSRNPESATIWRIQYTRKRPTYHSFSGKGIKMFCYLYE